MKILESALEYRNAGFSVIPMSPRDKRPLIKWTEYQHRLPEEAEVKDWWAKTPAAMVGIITGALSGLSVVDCDSPEARAQINDRLPDSLEIPTVKTPRGGDHFYFAYAEGIITKAGVHTCIDTRNEGGVIVAPPSVNAQGKAYEWQNDLPFCRDALPEMPEHLAAWLTCDLAGAPLINSILTNTLVRTKGTDDILTTPFSEGRRDNDLFTIANGLIKAGVDIGLASEVLRRLILSWGENVEEKWVNDKIESALKRSERREKALSDEVKEWILSSSGVFLSSDVVRCLQVSSRDERKNLSKIFSRLVEEKVIERCGERNGAFRKIDNIADEIEWKSAKVSPLEIRFPFQIESLVRILPKNIIVVAGEPDAGKTAFLLNFVELNMGNHEIFYFSSEMGKDEMSDRIKNFDRPFDQWRFRAFERAGNFADVIRPDAVNVIDFLEISDEFYKVSGYIKQIFDKLKGGIAVIALQKNRKTDYGLGGMRSLEKPRLYLAMEPGRVKIVKGKNWTNSTKNPNGLTIDFKLAKGCKFIPVSGWKRETV